ncbi:MAG TPA: FtsX-like permease family protein, partial [Gemmatimonadales bacterium]|nr:FtsX-like permease family protein [Gemmatimonadales bacterium]
GATGDTGRGRARSLLVIAEVALAFSLTIGAGLLVRAFIRVNRVPLGLQADGALTLALSLPRTAYTTAADRATFVERLRRELAGIPGVTAAAVISRLPLNPGASTRSIEVEGAVARRGESLEPDYLVTSPGYFRSLGIRLLAGRDFTERDRPGTAPVVIVSRKLAETLWPGVPVLGRRLKVGDDTAWRTVIGLAADVQQHGLDRAPEPALYLPWADDPWPFLTVALRTRGDPAALATPAEAVIHGIDPDLAVSSIRPMAAVVADSLVARRFSLLLIGLFAGLALVLAIVGVYGVMAHSVARRVRELGIRIALGARPADVLRLIAGYGLRLALSGIGLGLLLALGLAPLLQSLLFGVRPLDPVTFAVVTLSVLGVVLVAGLVPARRATRVDPMRTLREE